MTSSSRYDRYYYTDRHADHGRLYLTQLPRVVKNKNIERNRQSFITGNEEYGSFWADRGYGLASSRSAGLSSARTKRDLNFEPGQRSSIKTYDYYYHPSTYNYRTDYDNQLLSSVQLNNYLTRRYEGQDGTSRITLPAISSKHGGLLSTTDDLAQYRLDLAVSNKPSRWIYLPDIKAVDLQLHLQDDSLVTLQSVPFTFR